MAGVLTGIAMPKKSGHPQQGWPGQLKAHRLFLACVLKQLRALSRHLGALVPKLTIANGLLYRRRPNKVANHETLCSSWEVFYMNSLSSSLQS